MHSGTVLVTGACGFIGSHVSEALLSRGRSVIGVDSLDSFYGEEIKRGNLAEVEATAQREGARFVFARADIRDEKAMAALLEEHGVESVIHLAARAGVRPSIAEPALYADVNVRGTSGVFEACRRAGVGRVVMASSSSVYGNASRVPFSEEDKCLEPISPYAATKRACELLAHTQRHLHGTRIACLRFFTAFGERQRPDLAISTFMRKMMRGEPITVFGDGSMARDFTYIGDIVAGVLAAEERIDEHGLRIWNLGGSSPVTVTQLVRAIEEVSGIEARVEHKPVQPGDVERTYADLTRSGRELGFAPKTSLREGLTRQWAWMTERASAGAARA
ncbi:MAG: NAD-dependent epimerase/dehydratase family protein [Phycisphaerales bacterium]